MKSFEEFKVSLAAKVTKAEWIGWVVAPTSIVKAKSCCPLGTDIRLSSYPHPERAANYWQIHRGAATQFILGFDGHVPSEAFDEYREFYDLGAEYRQRAMDRYSVQGAQHENV